MTVPPALPMPSALTLNLHWVDSDFPDADMDLS